VNKYYNSFNELYRKYKALAERYNFYRFFIWNMERSASPSWSTSDAKDDKEFYSGFTHYDRSQIVLDDMSKGDRYNDEYSEEWYEGDRYADFRGFLGDEYIYELRTAYHNTNYCTGRDENGQTIGKNSYHWHYTGGRSRRLEVYLILETVRMPPDLYPFVGL